MANNKDMPSVEALEFLVRVRKHLPEAFQLVLQITLPNLCVGKGMKLDWQRLDRRTETMNNRKRVRPKRSRR